MMFTEAVLHLEADELVQIERDVEHRVVVLEVYKRDRYVRRSIAERELYLNLNSTERLLERILTEMLQELRGIG